MAESGGIFGFLDNALAGVNQFFDGVSQSFQKGLDIAHKITGFDTRTGKFTQSNTEATKDQDPEDGGGDLGLLLILGGLALVGFLVFVKR